VLPSLPPCVYRVSHWPLVELHSNSCLQALRSEAFHLPGTKSIQRNYFSIKYIWNKIQPELEIIQNILLKNNRETDIDPVNVARWAGNNICFLCKKSQDFYIKNTRSQNISCGWTWTHRFKLMLHNKVKLRKRKGVSSLLHAVFLPTLPTPPAQYKRRPSWSTTHHRCYVFCDVIDVKLLQVGQVIQVEFIFAVASLLNHSIWQQPIACHRWYTSHTTVCDISGHFSCHVCRHVWGAMPTTIIA